LNEVLKLVLFLYTRISYVKNSFGNREKAMKASTVGSEERAYKRRHLIYYLEVYDDETGELLGHIVDITVKGMRLITKKEIMPGKNFRLGMMLPLEFFQEGILKIEARSMWSRKDINPDFFAAGLKVFDLEESAAKLIANLIERVGFND
jgi:hypothetical protein